jgi:NAD(P)-dependent dehydrogenase (short-subunit alcohol dehydrogenase family)
MTTDPKLRGHIALITGATGGFGRAYARALADAGGRVALVGRRQSAVEHLLMEILDAGGDARAFVADITDAGAAPRIVADVERELGPVDILVNTAGVAGPIGPFVETSIDEWWETFDVNVRGPALWCRAVVEGMMARRRGRIINVASGAGTRPIVYFSAYVSSKAALIRFSETLALEVAHANVRVFSIQPGTARTAMTEAITEDDSVRRWAPWLVEIFEKGQDITPEHSARFVLRLARGDADALNGRFLNVRDDLDALVDVASRTSPST